MAHRMLILCLLMAPWAASSGPEVASYAKVSWNGRETGSDRGGSLSWISRVFSGENATGKFENEGRSVKNIAITVSPVYVPPKTRLKNGEAIDYPQSTTRYSTLDRQMVAKLDAKKQIQQRFHPPVLSFDREKPANDAPPASNGETGSGSSPNPPSYAEPAFPGPFSYAPPDFLSDKPISKPLGIDDYSPPEVKPPDSYRPPPDAYSTIQGSHLDDFEGNGPPAFANPDHPPFEGDHFDYDHHHDAIYDHIPDYHDHHHFHHHTTSTEKPEANDQRLDKRPYSYYFIGKKLWYVPLYFSIYFIFYIGALVLKSIARHKITFPAHLAEAVNHARSGSYVREDSWWNSIGGVLEGVESFAQRFGRES